MKFRPCIDLHEGKVKQIVGETLGSGSGVRENFVSSHGADHYAELFKRDGLTGGHVIMLGPGNEAEAEKALAAWPGGLQVGGGITAENAAYYLERGASHVIVTSYIFRDGRLDDGRLEKIAAEVGRDRLVIDLSCKASDGTWKVATNQWKVLSDFVVNKENLAYLQNYCAEFLVHAVDVEGKRSGIQEELARQLAEWAAIPATYAGGIRSLDDVERFRQLTGGKLDFTVGSALDLFGGNLPYRELVRYAGNGRPGR